MSDGASVAIDVRVRPFRFTLQPALDAAGRREAVLAAEAARAAAAHADARASLLALDRCVADGAEFRRALRAGAGRAAPWIAGELVAAHVRALGVRRRIVCGAASERAASAAALHVRERRGRMALERLRERRFAEYRAALERAEAAELDESNALLRAEEP